MPVDIVSDPPTRRRPSRSGKNAPTPSVHSLATARSPTTPVGLMCKPVFTARMRSRTYVSMLKLSAVCTDPSPP